MARKSLDGPGRDIGRKKDKLREEMRRLRASIPPSERAKLTDLVEEALFALPEVRSAGAVLIFYSFGTEIPTRGMADRILGAGKRLLLPFLTGDGAMEAAEVGSEEELEPSGYGPMEPSSRVAVRPSEVELVIAPGLAFDRQGHR